MKVQIKRIGWNPNVNAVIWRLLVDGVPVAETTKYASGLREKAKEWCQRTGEKSFFEESTRAEMIQVSTQYMKEVSI